MWRMNINFFLFFYLFKFSDSERVRTSYGSDDLIIFFFFSNHVYTLYDFRRIAIPILNRKKKYLKTVWKKKSLRIFLFIYIIFIEFLFKKKMPLKFYRPFCFIRILSDFVLAVTNKYVVVIEMLKKTFGSAEIRRVWHAVRRDTAVIIVE